MSTGSGVSNFLPYQLAGFMYDQIISYLSLEKMNV